MFTGGKTLTSALESAKSTLLSMNRSWVSKQGEFFGGSPINFMEAAIWYLRKYQEGKYCTLPHAIELLHIDYETRFTVLRTEMEIAILIISFVGSFIDGHMETLGSQISLVKIPLGRIPAPEFYWVLSGNDVALDINNPNAPKSFASPTIRKTRKRSRRSCQSILTG